MNKNFVIIAASLMFFISTYFSYEYFSTNVHTKRGGAIPVAKEVTDAKTGEKLEVIDYEGDRTEQCPLNGGMFTETHKEKWEKRRPLGIMIENHVDARPQSGLNAADVVYEFVAEGGITRFLSIFYCQDAPFVGPVRSARVYFIDMLRGYGNYPLYGHVGGANTPGPADALGTIKQLGWAWYNDLNQFSIAFPYYYRDYDRNPNVATEHTVYTSTEKLWEYAAEERGLTNVDEDGESWDESFEPWLFAKKEDPGAGDVDRIEYEFWDQKDTHTVVWQYDVESNSYKRSHKSGGEHIDKNIKKALSPKTVVVMFVKESYANDGYEGQHMLYGTTGKGEGLVFQNGEAIEVTWKKADEEDQVRFYDDSGDEIEFVGGQIWVSAIPTGNKVTY